jgi:benzylsuccinate CoA-transferase BbsF subunit
MSSKEDDVQGPLSGVRVVDLCWVYAGPVMTRVLADLGAEVIKVESRARLDGTRLGRRPLDPQGPVPDDIDPDVECQPLNHALNRNKRSFAVNIAMPAGRELILSLVEKSHLITDNFAAGIMAKLGLDHDALQAANPSIVALSMSGAGQFGPMKDAAAYANTLAPLCGLGSLVGDDDGLYGVMMPTYGDSNAAIRANGSLLVGLLNAVQGGGGQYIDVSEWEAGLVGMEEAFLEYQIEGRQPAPSGNRSAVASVHNNFRCRGEDAWLAISVTSDEQWGQLAAEIDDAELVSDARFATNEARLANREAVESRIEAWTSQQDAMTTARSLQARQVPAFPVLSVEDQFAEEHFLERGVFRDVEHRLVGAEIVPGLPFRYFIGDAEYQVEMAGAPTLGEANRYVVCDLLGRTTREFDDLVEQGVLG